MAAMPCYALLLVTATIFSAGKLGAGMCHPDERAALLRLKNSFSFDYALSNLSSWQVSFSSDCCTWQGISCAPSSMLEGQVVVGLDLADLSISGNLSSSDLFSLTSLRFLSLANNDFLGTQLPSSGFERLSSLQYLNLSYCGFIGQVPAGIARLHNLETLHLSGSYTWDPVLDRPIPYLELKNLGNLINNLGSLKRLYLDYTNISLLNAPSSVNDNASSLQDLNLSGCWLSGLIDNSLAKLWPLSKLILDNTMFSYPVPVLEFLAEFDLSSLQVLSLRRSGLIGIFPCRIFRIKTLTVLDLSGNDMIYGELPEFIQGSPMHHLVLSFTKFSGNIPESIANLHSLSVLDLSNCQFYGAVPSFAQWPMISEVDLSNNNLVGSLPSDGYSTLHNLTRIYLGNNSISGEMPASLFSHPSLLELDLSKNNLTGNLLFHPNASSKLQYLFLSENNLQGSIPDSLSNLSGLTRLDLSSNNFTGTMDLNVLKDCTNLSVLSLSNNMLSVLEEGERSSFAEYPKILNLNLASCNLSKVPMFLMYQNDVERLDLSNNNIVGPVPDWIWRAGANAFYYVNLSHNLLTSIQGHITAPEYFVLDLHSNKLEGSLPLPPLYTSFLDCSNNHFTHSIPTKFLSHLSSASYLSLSNNKLVGGVPSMICNASKIQVLDLSFNSLSGPIPPCLLQQNMSIAVLNLKANRFQGSLPQNINKGCALETLNLNSNKLEGELPESLVKCKMLQLLDVGDNQLSDTFPNWLGGLSWLKVFVLRSNRFHGPIATGDGIEGQNMSFFPALQVFDLSANAFSGRIPPQFLKKLKAMMSSSEDGSQARPVGYQYAAGMYYESSVTVILKGLDLTLVRILSTFKALDLSNNSFGSIVPSEIGDLKSLKALNLSMNAFIGRIPVQTANMVQLESLDLSKNQLSGEIPPGWASSLTFLAVLNLSYNRLIGSIPQSGQFSTFLNTSYTGNAGLCGSPLSRQCDGTTVAASPPAVSSSSAGTHEVNWDIVSVEVGVVCGLATVAGSLVFWRPVRYWFIRNVDKLLMHVLVGLWIRHRHS